MPSLFCTLAMNLGMMEIVLILFFGVLIFGKRLPEIGKNVGKSIVEFKKGLAGADEEASKNVMAMKSQQLLSPPSAPEPPAQPSTTDLQEQLRLANERIKALEQQTRNNKGTQA